MSRNSRNSTTRSSSSMWYTVQELIKALLIVVTIQAMDAFFPPTSTIEKCNNSNCAFDLTNEYIP